MISLEAKSPIKNPSAIKNEIKEIKNNLKCGTLTGKKHSTITQKKLLART
jgi:hypothetical protein